MKGYGQFCPVAKAAEVLAERWTPLLLRELLCGSTTLPRRSPGHGHHARAGRDLDGDLSWEAAERSGELRVDGRRHLAAALPGWLALSTFAAVERAAAR